MGFEFGRFQSGGEQGKIEEREVEEFIPFEIKMPGGSGFVPLGKWQIRRKFEDEIGPRLLLILDELSELLMDNKVRTEEGKLESQLKQECLALITSIAQLGRSAGIHLVLATQRPDATIISGNVKNNPLALDTKLIVLRKKAA